MAFSFCIKNTFRYERAPVGSIDIECPDNNNKYYNGYLQDYDQVIGAGRFFNTFYKDSGYNNGNDNRRKVKGEIHTEELRQVNAGIMLSKVCKGIVFYGT